VVLLKAALNGELGADAFADPRLAAAMELCVGCKGCKRECANQVDMAAIRSNIRHSAMSDWACHIGISWWRVCRIGCIIVM